MWAAKSRSSNESTGKNDATVGTLNGSAVALTVIGILAEILGVPPGLLILHITNSPKLRMLVPMT